MPALQVRDFPDELYEELKNRAEAEHRSIAQQTIVAVKSYLESVQQMNDERERKQREKQDRIERKRMVFEKISQYPKFEVPDDFPTIEEIVREMRDSR